MSFVHQNPKKIIEYYSPMGNNEFSYPIAVSEKNIYFMYLSDCFYANKSEFKNFNNWINAYDYFYKNKNIIVNSIPYKSIVRI